MRHIPDAFDLCNAVMGDPWHSRDYLEETKRWTVTQNIKLHFSSIKKKKKKKKVYCSQFNCKINSLNVPFHADGRFIKHSELVGIRHNKQNHDKMTKNRKQQM